MAVAGIVVANLNGSGFFAALKIISNVTAVAAKCNWYGIWTLVSDMNEALSWNWQRCPVKPRRHWHWKRFGPRVLIAYVFSLIHWSGLVMALSKFNAGSCW